MTTAIIPTQQPDAEQQPTAPHAHAAQPAAAPTLPDFTHATAAHIALKPKAREDAAALVARAAAREQIEEGEWPTFYASIKARYEALRNAIHPNSAAAHAFGHMFDADYKTHVQEGREHAMAMQDVQSIFLNRAADIQATLRWLNTPEAEAELKATLGKQLPELNTTLNDEKLQEIKRSLSADGNGGTDSPIHVKHNFLAQHKLHAKLMDAFAEGSPVHKALEADMLKALPETAAAENAATHTSAFLADWLSLREKRAEAVMIATRPDAALAQQAVAEWEAQRHTTPAQPQATAPAPAPAAPTTAPSTVVSDAQREFAKLVKEAANENSKAPAKALASL